MTNPAAAALDSSNAPTETKGTAYAILGAILTALAVITFSGVLKPKAD